MSAVPSKDFSSPGQLLGRMGSTQLEFGLPTSRVCHRDPHARRSVTSGNFIVPLIAVPPESRSLLTCPQNGR